MILTLILFFAISLGIGHFVDLLVPEWKGGLFEKMIIRFGAGILGVSVLGVIFNHLMIPLYWPFFLVVAMIISYLAIKKDPKIYSSDLKGFIAPLKDMKIKKDHIYSFLAIILFIVSMNMYMEGTFNTEWLEDGDPYGYATQSKYIAEEMTYEADEYYLQYSSPYTQGYQIYMGVLHQTNDSIYMTLKLLMAVIVSFSILFLYYAIKRFSGDASMAFWGTFAAAMVPAWVSHFIFSLSYNMALIPVLLYSVFAIENDKRWRFVSGILLGALWINHFYTAVIMTLMLVIAWFLKLILADKGAKYHFESLALGMIVWLFFHVPALIKHSEPFLEGSQLGGLYIISDFVPKIAGNYLMIFGLLGILALILFAYIKSDSLRKIQKQALSSEYTRYSVYAVVLLISAAVLLIPDEIISAEGTATRSYDASDFFFTTQENLINNPIGIGLVIMTVFTLGMIFMAYKLPLYIKKKEFKPFLVFNWVLFSFIGVMGADLSIAMTPFRMWTFFALALAIAFSYHMNYIKEYLSTIIKDVTSRKLVIAGIFLIIIVGGYYTSFQDKVHHNTASWPEHELIDPSFGSQEIYINMREGLIPKDSMMLPFCNYPHVAFGYDMYAEPWETRDLYSDYRYDDRERFYERSLEEPLEESHSFLVEHGYEYTAIGLDCVARMDHDPELLEAKIQEMLESPQFQLIDNRETQYLFRIVN